MRLAKETIWFTTKTLSFAVLVLLILFTVVPMTGSALPDNEVSGQLNPESTAVYVLDADHHHLGDGVKQYNADHKKCCSHRYCRYWTVL